MLERLKGWWDEQSSSRKRMWIVMAVALVISVGSLTFYTTRVNYVPLFSGLDAGQLNSIILSLQQERVPYRLGDAGTSILVPDNMVHELKIKIAGEGLYNSGIGFELFDQMKLGITDFERRLNYQRALEEELRRTISFYPEVEQVRVHLVIPEQSVFIQQTQEASASVTLKLRAFRTLSPQATKSLVYLVALSVPNLSPERVSVIDVGGRILSEGLALGGGDTTVTTARQTEMARSFERELEQKIVHILDRIYGPGRSVAVVTADLNFDQETVTRIIYDNDGQVVRSEQIRDERYNSTGGDVGGVAGTGANIPFYPGGAEGGGSETTYESSERTTHYEIDTTQSTMIVAPGRLIRLSTAVSVNAELTEAQQEELGRLVSATVGHSPERGDSLVVSALNFNMEHVDRAREELAEQLRSARMQEYIRYGIWAAGGLLAFILLIVVVRRITAAAKVQEPEPLPIDLVSIQEAMNQAAVAKTSEETQNAMTKVREMAKNNPEEVAMLVKAWFKEG